MESDMRRPIGKVMYYDTPFMHPSRGMYMEVYDNLVGDGEFHEEERVASGNVSNLSYDWANSAPYGASKSEFYLIRWMGWFCPDHTGDYRVIINKETRDGVKVWFGTDSHPRDLDSGDLEINLWSGENNIETSGIDLAFVNNQWCGFKIEYRHMQNEGRFSMQYREPQSTNTMITDYDPCVYFDGNDCTNAECKAAFWETRCVSGISYQTYISKSMHHPYPIEAYKVFGADKCSYQSLWLSGADCHWVSGYSLPYVSSVKFSKKLKEASNATVNVPLSVHVGETEGYLFSNQSNCYYVTLSGGHNIYVKPNRLVKIHGGYSGPCAHYNNNTCNVGHTSSGNLIERLCKTCGNPSCYNVVDSGVDMPVVFTGFVAPFSGDRTGLTLDFTIYDFLANLSDTFIGNVPNENSYNCARFFGDFTSMSPDGIDRPMCYDGWPVGDAIRDLALQAGFNASQLFANKILFDSNNNEIIGNREVGGNDIVLPRPHNYGNPYIYADEAASAKDDKYLWSFNFDMSPLDAVNKIADAYGMHVGIDANGNLRVSTYNDYKIYDDNFIGWDISAPTVQGDGTHHGCITASYTQMQDGGGMTLSGVKASRIDIVLYLNSGDSADDLTSFSIKKHDTDTTVYSSVLPAYYTTPWAYLDGIDSTIGYNPCVISIYGDALIETGDSTPLDVYDIYMLDGRARIDAVIAYLEDIQYPLYKYSNTELISGDVMTNFGMKENYDDIRNDVVVIGSHKGYVTYQGQAINENNKINKYVFSRATDVDSVLDIDNPKSIGKKQSLVIFEPGIQSQSHANWLAGESLLMYRQASHTPSVKSVGNPFLEINDSVKIIDSGQNVSFVGWISSISYELATTESTQGCVSDIGISPFAPWPSYKPSLYGDVTRYSDSGGNLHGFVNISVTDTDNEVRMNTTEQFVASSFSMYEAEGSSPVYPGKRYLQVKYNQVVPGYVLVKVVTASKTEQEYLYDFGNSPYKQYKQPTGNVDVAYLIGEKDSETGDDKPEYRDIGAYMLYWDATDVLNATHLHDKGKWHISNSDNTGGVENLYVSPGRYKVVLEVVPSEYVNRKFITETNDLPNAFNNPDEGVSVSDYFYKVFWDIWRFKDDHANARLYLHDHTRAADGATNAGATTDHTHIPWFSSEENNGRGSKLSFEIVDKNENAISRLIDYRIAVSHYIYSEVWVERAAGLYPFHKENPPRYYSDYTTTIQLEIDDIFYRAIHGVDNLIQMSNVVYPKEFSGFKPCRKMVDVYYRPDSNIGGAFRFEQVGPGAVERFNKLPFFISNLANPSKYVNMYNAHAFEYSVMIADKSGFLISGMLGYVRDTGDTWKQACVSWGGVVGGKGPYPPMAGIFHSDETPAGDRWWPNMMGMGSTWQGGGNPQPDGTFRMHTWWIPPVNSEYRNAGSKRVTSLAVNQVIYKDAGLKTQQRISANSAFVENIQAWGPVELHDVPPEVRPLI